MPDAHTIPDTNVVVSPTHWRGLSLRNLHHQSITAQNCRPTARAKVSDLCARCATSGAIKFGAACTQVLTPSDTWFTVTVQAVVVVRSLSRSNGGSTDSREGMVSDTHLTPI
jgi:hypothetical protein